MQRLATKDWYVENWGVWGWAETFVKLVALFAGMGAFITALPELNMMLEGNPRLVAVGLTGLLTFASLGLTFVRLQQKEIVSFVFALVNVLGHGGALIALLSNPNQTSLLIAFAVLYAVGQLVKIGFLQTSGYTEQRQTTSGMIRFNVVITNFYIALILALVL